MINDDAGSIIAARLFLFLINIQRLVVIIIPGIRVMRD